MHSCISDALVRCCVIFLTRGEALPETGQIKCFVVCYYEVSISSTTLVSQGIYEEACYSSVLYNFLTYLINSSF